MVFWFSFRLSFHPANEVVYLGGLSCGAALESVSNKK